MAVFSGRTIEYVKIVLLIQTKSHCNPVLSRRCLEKSITIRQASSAVSLLLYSISQSSAVTYSESVLSGFHEFV